MTSAVLTGSTGLVGSHILTTLINHPSITSIHAYSRRKLPTSSPKLHDLESPDTNTWPGSFPAASKPSLFLSALGTTKGQAGSVEAQRKIDYDLNLALAEAAKAAGVSTYVLVSTTGASATSSMAYPKMKGELEEKVKGLGFAHCVILRPGLIVGEREDSRPAEAALRWVARAFGSVSEKHLKDFWAQDASVIARAAVAAGVQCVQGERSEKGVWTLTQADIVRLGRTEWKE